MKKNHLLSIFLIAFSLIIANCAKEGPEGPPGALGPQGPGGNTGAIGLTGPQGPAGSANVIYSNWFGFTAADWADTTMYSIAFKRAIRPVTSLTQAVFDNGTILTYLKFTSPATNISLLPTIQYYNNPQTFESHNTIINVGKLIYTFQNVMNGGIVNYAPTANQYRYIIIPGGVLGGRLINGESTYSGYTVEQLQSMSYEIVASLFNIPENGTNLP